MSHEILIVEDDEGIRRFLRISLRSEGYRVSEAGSGSVAVSLFEANAPSLVLLDLGLPDGDGMDVLNAIRKKSNAPIIVLTARSTDSQKVQALDAGADDYVVKPFSIVELFARIRVALRHSSLEEEVKKVSRYAIDGLEVDCEAHSVVLDGEPIHLTPHEFDLLVVMMENQGKVLTHRFIQEKVWDYPVSDGYRTLRVIMASLRRKLKDRPATPRFIGTEVGVGYRFVGRDHGCAGGGDSQDAASE